VHSKNVASRGAMPGARRVGAVVLAAPGGGHAVGREVVGGLQRVGDDKVACKRCRGWRRRGGGGGSSAQHSS
jgi:hypothetical protein